MEDHIIMKIRDKESVALAPTPAMLVALKA